MGKNKIMTLIVLFILAVGVVVAAIGMHHDLTHKCLRYERGGVPPTFDHCAEWNR